MNEERMGEVADALFGYVLKRQKDPWTPSSLPEVVAYGIEVALAWKPGDREEREDERQEA